MKSSLSIWLAIALTTSASAQTFELISRSDYFESEAQENRYPSFSPKSTPDPTGPVIEVRSPSLMESVKAPVFIDLRFRTSGTAQINWDSLRILYGWYRKDITEEVKKRAKMIHDGIQIDSANLPSGNHKLLIQVANTEGKQAEREVRFTVE